MHTPEGATRPAHSGQAGVPVLCSRSKQKAAKEALGRVCAVRVRCEYVQGGTTTFGLVCWTCGRVRAGRVERGAPQHTAAQLWNREVGAGQCGGKNNAWRGAWGVRKGLGGTVRKKASCGTVGARGLRWVQSIRVRRCLHACACEPLFYLDLKEPDVGGAWAASPGTNLLAPAAGRAGKQRSSEQRRGHAKEEAPQPVAGPRRRAAALCPTLAACAVC